MIDVAVAGGDGELLNQMIAFAAQTSDLRVSGSTADGLLSAATFRPDVVLIDVTPGRGARVQAPDPVRPADPVDEVHRLRAGGHRVLVVARGGAPDLATTLPAGECVMLDGRDQDLPDLAAAIRAVVEGDCAPGVDVGQPEHGRARPRLSEREESVLRAYASGLTLDAAARQVGVRPSTAKTYLERVKEKYRQAGRPAYTKTELAQRVREDCPHC